MRPVSLLMPWKPETTATSLRSLKRLMISAAVDIEDARRAVRVGGLDRDLPALPRARLDAERLQRDRQQAGRHLLAGGDHGVVLARVVQRRRFRRPADQLVGLAGHGGDHDGDLVARVDLALHMLRNVADALDIGDGRSAEFHHETAHDVRRDLPLFGFAARRAKTVSAGAKRRVYIPTGGGDRNRFRPAFQASSGSCAASKVKRNEGLMGRYIDEILQPDEKVLFSTTIHWIVYCRPSWPGSRRSGCFALARGAVEGVTILWLALSGSLALIALYWTFRAWFQRWTSETDVTTMRVVHKEGFIQRETFEMNLDKVESVDVKQSIPARIFGYGDVTIRGVGEGDKDIKMIASPLQFRNHITAR